MSQRAQKAVEDAMVVASRLKAAGHSHEAEIIRRVCRSNASYRTTLGQLWRDNMELRGLNPPLTEAPTGEIGDMLMECHEDAIRIGDAPPPTAPREPRPRYTERQSATVEEAPRSWCDQCERRVTAERAASCSSPFCKAKAIAA